ncbi:hypothetical protein CN425_17565 [Bacillus cereus]|uniref:Uncharacterized protein n=2 Tax=Bacillus cereus TaxID=1396 RepID=A0A2A8PUZ1_BACCE|nr:hypothetical protein CN425_17565 [Bacillus cereus]
MVYDLNVSKDAECKTLIEMLLTICMYDSANYSAMIPHANKIKGLLAFCDSGTTSQCPTNILHIGIFYFDTTLNKPIWWNGTVWKDANGTTV